MIASWEEQRPRTKGFEARPSIANMDDLEVPPCLMYTTKTNFARGLAEVAYSRTLPAVVAKTVLFVLVERKGMRRTLVDERQETAVRASCSRRSSPSFCSSLEGA